MGFPLVWSHFMLTIPRSFERLETVPILLPHTHTLTQSADLQVIWSYYVYLKWNMENASSLWARKSFVFASPWLIDNDTRSGTTSSCCSSGWCQPKGVAWPHYYLTRRAYPQNSLSFLASGGKRTNLSWAYIFGSRDARKYNVTIYIHGHRVQRVKYLKLESRKLAMIDGKALNSWYFFSTFVSTWCLYFVHAYHTWYCT